MMSLFRRVRLLLARSRREDDLAEEIRQHLERRRESLVDAGMDAREAEIEARRAFGNVTAVRDRSRDLWSLPMVDAFVQDLKYGLRQLRRAPFFTAVVIIVMAVGIGANTAVFSILNATLLRWAAAYREPGRLVLVWQTRDKELWTPTPADFRDWRASVHAFSGIDAYTYASYT